MPSPPAATKPKRKHVRLWPLMLFPIVGLLTGYFFARERIPLPFGIGRLDPVTSTLFGLLGGCMVMVASASAVLAYRVAQRRFTIGAILITIAVIAAILGWARANL
jgi:hypothetical protein